MMFGLQGNFYLKEYKDERQEILMPVWVNL